MLTVMQKCNRETLESIEKSMMTGPVIMLFFDRVGKH